MSISTGPQAPLQQLRAWWRRSTGAGDNALMEGLKQGILLAAAILVVVLPQAPRPQAQQAQYPTLAAERGAVRQLVMGSQSASADMLELAHWVVRTADNGTQAFAILDKKEARVFVFEPSGRLQDSTPVLLGYARGDDSVEGIGDRPIDQIRPEERTTPAGRFVAHAGLNAALEEVLWVDYGAAVSMHRVRLTTPSERRLERLASPVASERRISYGCINMPVEFFENVLWPMLGRRGGIVYILPEVNPLTQVFPQLTVTPALPATSTNSGFPRA